MSTRVKSEIKIAITITCENQSLRSIIEESIQDSLLSTSRTHHLGAIKIVRDDDSWDYWLRYTVIEKNSPFVEIHVKYNWNRHVTHETSDTTNMEIDQVDIGVYQERLEELSEFCLYQAHLFSKGQETRRGPQ